jgi:HAD superfamily hydrolase (TIGR01509 family)
MKTILVDAINTFIIKGEGVFKDMFDLLEKYPNPKIVLTNANDEEVKKFNLVNLPYRLFTLKHNPNKTDPSYFTTMLDNFGLNANDVIYFEHNLEAIKSAESVGIKSFHYVSEARDLDKLKSFIDLYAYQKGKSEAIGEIEDFAK